MGNSGSSQRDNGDRASRFSRRNNDAEAIELATSALDEEAGENICDDTGDGHLNNRANNAYQDHVAKAGQQNIEASTGQYEEAATNGQRVRKAVASQDETDTLKILEETKRPDSELLWEYTPRGRDNENSEYIRIHSSRNSPRGEQFVQPDPYNRRLLDKGRISKWQTEHSKKDTMREQRQKGKLFQNGDISAVSSPIPIPIPRRSHEPVFRLRKKTQGIIGRKWRSDDHNDEEDNDNDCDNNYDDDGNNIGDDVDAVVDNDDNDKNNEEEYHEEKYLVYFKKCAYLVGNYATKHTNYATSLKAGVGDDDKEEELAYCRKADHEQDTNLEQSCYNVHADITYSGENNQTQRREASYNIRQHRVRDTDKSGADDKDDEEAYYEQIDYKIHSKAVYNIKDQEREDIPKVEKDANEELMTNEYVNSLKIAYNIGDQKRGAARELNPISEEPENQFLEDDMHTRETEYWNSEYTSEDDHLFEYEQPKRSQHKEILAKYPELRLNLSEDLVNCPTSDDTQDENQKIHAPKKKHKHKTKEKKNEEAKMKEKLKFGQLVRGIISKAKNMFASAKKEDEIKESASHVKKKKKKLTKRIKTAKCDTKRAKPGKNTQRYMGGQDESRRLLDPKQYGSLAYMKQIRQESASNEICISHVKKTVDTWNKPNPGNIYSPQRKNEWPPVLDQRKNGSLAYYHQAKESNPEMMHYIKQARTQLSTWQSKSQMNALQKEPRQSDSDANRDHIRQMKATVKTAKSTNDSGLQNPHVADRHNDHSLTNWSRHFTNNMYRKNGNSNGILRNLDCSKLGGDDHPGNISTGRQAGDVKTDALETTNKARHVRSEFLNDDQWHKYTREPRRNKVEFTSNTTDFVDDRNQHRRLLGASDHRMQMIRIASDFIISEHSEQNRSGATQNKINFSREMSGFLKNENEIKDLCKHRRQSIVEDLDLVKEAHKRREQHVRKRIMTDLHVAPEFFAQENGESTYFSGNKMKDPQNPGWRERDETNKTWNLVEEARQRKLKQRYGQTKTDLHIPYEFLRNEKRDISDLLKSENEIKDQPTVRKQEMGEEYGKLDIMEEAHRRREKQCHRHNMTDLHISPELLSNDRQCNTMAVTPAFLKEDFKQRYPLDPKQMAGKITDPLSVSIHQKEMHTARQRRFDMIPNINDLSTDLYFKDNHISSKEEGKHAAKRQLGEPKNSTRPHQQQQQQGLTRYNRAENFSVKPDDKPGINLQKPEEEKTQCIYRLPLPTRLFPDSGTGGFEDRQ